MSLLDHPFSRIEYPPVSKSVVFGTDYQVWAHLDRLIHMNPFRYSWISSIFLGSFHKLGNLHGKLLKRYGKFHIEKHAIAFLNSPSASKVQYLLSMKDFDSSNQFYYHDVIAGLIELCLLFRNYNDKTSNSDENETSDKSLENVNITEVKDFCYALSEK